MSGRGEDGTRGRVVLDTNLFVAAGFRPASGSARILDAVRRGDLRLVWNDATRGEVRRVLRQIPPLSWRVFKDLFRDENRWPGALDLSAYCVVSDAADRPFAALAQAAGAALITSDEHLLGVRDQLVPLAVLTPGEYAHAAGLPRAAEEASPNGAPGRSSRDPDRTAPLS